METWKVLAVYLLGGGAWAFLWGLLAVRLFGVERNWNYEGGGLHPDYYLPVIIGTLAWPIAFLAMAAAVLVRLGEKTSAVIEDQTE